MQARLRQRLAELRARKLKLEFDANTFAAGFRALDALSLGTDRHLVTMGDMFNLNEGVGSEYAIANEVVRQQHLVARQEILLMRQAVTDLFGDLLKQRKSDEARLEENDELEENEE